MASKIDKILHKYHNHLSQIRNDGLNTQRKIEGKHQHFMSFMDTDTPIKDNKYQNFITTNETSQNFDNTQKKIAVHELFREGDRKYEYIRQASHSLEMEMERERKLHLQELINLQSKVSVLQANNNANITKMKSQEDLIMLLEQKLKQKEQEVIIYESELQMMSRKMLQTKQLRQAHNQKIGKKHLVSDEQSNKALEFFRQKYEAEIGKLNLEIERFHWEVSQKQKQKRKVMQEMQIMSKGYIQQNKLMRQSMSRCEEQFKGWLDESKKEKLDLIQKYEEEIREIKKQYYTQRLNKTDTGILSENKNRNEIKQLQNKGTELENEIVRTKKQVQILNRINGEITIKLTNFQQHNQHLQVQLQTQTNQNNNNIQKLFNLQQKLQATCDQKQNIQKQLGSSQRQNDTIALKNKQLQKQLLIISQKLQKTEQLYNEQKRLQLSENSVANMNLSLTQTITNLKITIKNLQLELEDITTQLYAERLQKAKIREEFQESKIQLKREYELSLESTKKQLESEMKITFGKTAIDLQKEQLYLEMFEIERKYQLLKSQVITSNQMLRMGEKMTQFYQRKKK